MIRDDVTRWDKVLRFFMYSYLEVSLDSDAGEILKASIKRAYRDAASHVLSILDEEQKKNCRDSAEKIIEKEIDKLKRSAETITVEDANTKYDKWHCDLCDSLCKAYAGCEFGVNKDFTYGIAQKWVNMAMKYLYLVYCWTVDDSECEDYTFHEEYGHMLFVFHKSLHIPIDNYMLRAIKVNSNSPIFPNGNLEIKGLGINYKEYALPDSWSRITDYDNVYMKYQEAIRKSELFNNEDARFYDYGPIDWEISAWIEESKRRKKK